MRLLSSALVLVVAVTSGCDLFGIRCNDADDCPEDLPFCVEDFCSATPGTRTPGNEGEGEGEGEGESCQNDSQCAALCYDVDDGLAPANTCLSAANIGNCTGTEVPQRDDNGPVIIDVELTPQGTDCYQVTGSYFARENVQQTMFFFINGDPVTETFSISDTSFFGQACPGTLPNTALVMRDANENHSNAICLAPRSAP